MLAVVFFSEAPFFFLCIFPPDEDECVLPGVCLHGRCVNLDGTHKCTCNHGYQVTSDSKACEGLQRIIQGCWVELVTAYLLLSRQQNNANYFFLLDVNECATGNVCPAGICINAPGSYNCQNCSPGFGPSADGLRCEGAKPSAQCFTLNCCFSDTAR